MIVEKKEYLLPWGWDTKLFTLVALILLGLLPVWVYPDFQVSSRPSQIFSLLLLGLVIVLLIYIALRTPLSYTRSPEGIELKLRGGKKVLFTHAEYEIDEPSPEIEREIKSSWRIFGSGGFFGFTGYFNVRGRGCCRFYLTGSRLPALRLRERTTNKYIYLSQGTPKA